MNLLDWVSIVGLSGAILCFFFALFSFFLMIRLGKKLRRLQRIRIKNKKKRKRLIREKKQYQKKRRSRLVSAIFFIFTGIILMVGAAYTVYYQATTLSAEDKTAIVKGYYYVRDLENELLSSEEDSFRESNIRTLSARLSAYATNNADYRYTEDGQLVVNRYYSSLKSLGLNVVTLNNGGLKDSTLVEGFQADIEKAKTYEKKVFSYYSINEAALKQQGK